MDASNTLDKYCKPINYKIRPNNTHFDDSKCHNDKWQKEVYVYASEIMEKKGFNKIIDIGCGSGYKLIKYLGKYETIGYETEPCISFLRKTYPNNKWINSGEPSTSFNNEGDKQSDLIMSSDVIEHIADPDELINYMKSFSCDYFLISTPCLEMFVNHHGWARYGIEQKLELLDGPPNNTAHVREWTFDEFKMYLSKHFKILESYLGKKQIYCQWHLCTRK
uniref:Methyltransferase n=1 Tax=viral metagenome TaxID=1070528 RepID=A0A6C0FFH2_9ZZZZ|tara:strand:- start:44166 stop:44828 length:663 start_codon:yes stop_codon:yes gene_type:complete